MHPTAERREHADPPVADLVAEALDDDRPIRRHDPGRGLLLAQVRDEVPRRAPVEHVLAFEHAGCRIVGQGCDLPRRATDLLTQLCRPADALALPEGRHARNTGSRRDEHPVPCDLLDPPRRGAEQKRLAGPGLVHHLLVELTDSPAAVDQEHAEEAPIGDRARIRDGEEPRAGSPSHDARRAIPHDSWTQLGELVGGVAPGEHVEDVLELRAREVGKRIRAPNELVELVHRDFLVSTDCNDLLREHVQWVTRDPRLLDRALPHGLGDDGRLEEIGSELGEDSALRDRVQVVPRPSHALKAASDRLRGSRPG